MLINNDAYDIAGQLTDFYSASVGRPMDYKKETALLLAWNDAIEAGLEEAKKHRLRWLLRDMLNFKAEFNVFIELNEQVNT